jgi:hypothetical protein
MKTPRWKICALTTAAGLASPVLAQGVYSPSDPVLREAMRRVYGMSGGPADGVGGPDVIVGEIESFGCCPQGTQIPPEASSGGIVAYGLGTSSCNISTAATGGQHLLWVANTPFHPIIPQNLYRLKAVNGATRLVQLGQSWSKYAFVALTDNVCNVGCSGVGGSVLGMGCSDPYTASRNATQSSAGPRYQCNPFTGVFPDSTAVRNAWPAATTSLHRRLQVLASEIDPALNAGALYFGEAMYVNRDDACWGNSKNNASYRRLTFASPSNTITLQGTSNGVSTGTARTKPAIYAWRDHGLGINTPDNNVMISEVTCGNTFFTQPAYPYNGAQGAGSALILPAGDGWVYVASRATDLGGGIWHYEYAVENLNSDRGIRSFRINFGSGTAITNAQMRQVDCHSGVAAEDANRNATWSQTINSDHIIWDSPNTWNAATPQLGSYIRWGTMYNFRFDANVAPAVSGNATLGYFKPLTSYPNTIDAAAHVPGGGTTQPPCYPDCDGVGGLTANDFSCFLIGYVGGTSYANCDGVGGLTANDFSCFLIRYVAGCS